MRRLFPFLLWLWIAACLIGAFLWAPLAEGFLGQSSRILFFHVPCAWASFIAFLTAGIWSIYSLRRRRVTYDMGAVAAVQLGILFCVLATITGAVWAKVMWGAWWNWDPRQTSIVVVLVFYAAYLVLRGAIEDDETRQRVAAVYAILGLVVAPFFYFVLPRMVPFSLHPESVINVEGQVEMERRMLVVLLGMAAGFTALFFWLHGIQRRILISERVLNV